MAVKHRCFVSYHQADETSAKEFIDEFSDVFTAEAIGVSDEDDFIDSDDPDYVMRRIRELYLRKSTVTIVLVGSCTWARKYVDWEIASTLRDDPANKRSGLLAIELKSIAGGSTTLPSRLRDNLDGSEGYACYWRPYPSTSWGLRSGIEDALKRRDSKTPYPARDFRAKRAVRLR